MTSGADVVLGVPLYGPAVHLREALESLLAQTHEDFALVLCDDGPGDAAAAVVEAVAGGDGRVSYRRNERRLGLVDNWRRTFHLAGELQPRAKYFGWASDHDACHPRWLERLVDALELSPHAVMAYGRTYRFDSSGRVLREVGHFQTVGVSNPRERLASSLREMVAGDMVYGLFRREALARAGVLPRVTFPDRLLLAELSLQGEFVYVPRALRYRRITARATLSRQRAGSFPGRVPTYARLPWWLLHTAAFAWSVTVQRAAPGSGRSTGARLAATHARLNAAFAAKSWTGRVIDWLGRQLRASLTRFAAPVHRRV
jgi:glycosyltransferase involved in cell wall biosynthesis